MVSNSYYLKNRTRRMSGRHLIPVLIGLLMHSSVTANNYKHVAVPTQQIKEQALPSLMSGSSHSHSTMLPLTGFTKSPQITARTSWSQKIIIDSNEPTSILFLSPQANQLELVVEAPNGKVYLNESDPMARRLPIEALAVGNQSFSGKRLALPAASAGTWKISMRPTHGLRLNKEPAGYLLAKGEPAFQLVTHLDNQFTTQNSTTHLVAYLINNNGGELSRARLTSLRNLTGLIHLAKVKVTHPNGKVTYISLNDQGVQGDKVAGDGKFTGPLPTHMLGVYRTEVYIEGVRPDGIPLSRSTADLYPIEAQSFDFSRTNAQLTAIGGTRSSVRIPVQQLGNAHREIFVAGEVWGTNSQGKLVAATWIGGIATPTKVNKKTWLDIGFDSRWLSFTNLKAPYQMKNLRMQTVASNTPIAQLSVLPLRATKSSIPKPDNGLTNQFIADNRSLVSELAAANQPYLTNDMLVVPAPGNAKSTHSSSTDHKAPGGKLMLVHGYCSKDVWNSDQFTNDIKFRDFERSRSHDEFARLIRDFGAAYPSFGVVAHSQGGAAALHLYAKYYSGLDYASSGRLIQTVGTPYQGTSLAGNIAALGDIFGLGCGKNTDLTYNGAANWLSTIPGWARSKVNFYTTSFTKKWWRPDWCNFASDFILSDPEDGTTEKWSGQLAGGINRGHKTGWCHTRNMRDPAQFRDGGRNSTMNANAAR